MSKTIKKKKRGRPKSNQKDRWDIPKTIKFNQELLSKLEEIRKDEGDGSLNSLIRRLCLNAIKRRDREDD